MFIDLIFLTNLYQRKHPIKKYWLMTLVMGTLILIQSIFLNSYYKLIFHILTCLIIIYLFLRKIQPLAYFSFSFAIMSLIDVFLISTVSLNYNYIGVLNIVIKLFFILTLFKELNKLNVILNFKTITNKILCILFSFLCLCSAIYLQMMWR